jgi:RNA polymerase sigma-70 factor (ECF subfamily)
MAAIIQAFTDAAQKRARLASQATVKAEIARAQRMREAEEAEEERRLKRDSARLKVETTSRFRNPFEDNFAPEDQDRVRAALDKTSPRVRTLMTMALDPRDTLPLTGFAERLRNALSLAREGDTASLEEITNNSGMMEELTKTGSDILNARVSRQRAREEIKKQQVGYVGLRTQERFKREEILHGRTEAMRNISIALDGRDRREFAPVQPDIPSSDEIEKIRGDAEERADVMERVEENRERMEQQQADLARFVPEGVTIQVWGGEDSFYDPKSNTVNIPQSVLDNPGGMGTLIHEGAHAVHSGLTPKEKIELDDDMNFAYNQMTDVEKEKFFHLNQSIMGQTEGDFENKYEVGGPDEILADAMMLYVLRGDDALPEPFLRYIKPLAEKHGLRPQGRPQGRTFDDVIMHTTLPEGVIAPDDDDDEALMKRRIALRYRGFFDKLKKEFYPDEDVEFKIMDEYSVAMIGPSGIPINHTLPSRLVETVHGRDTAERYSVTGYSSLPDDSPLRRPGLGEGTLRILMDTAELIDGPRMVVKHEIIEPILPEFEVELPSIAEVAPYLIPGVNMATLATQALNRGLGIDIPEFSDLLKEIPGLDYHLNLTDDIVAEVMSFVLDPLNLLPVIGWGNDIARIAKFAGISLGKALPRKVGPKIASELGAHPALRDALLAGERGGGLLGGEAAERAAREVAEVPGREVTERGAREVVEAQGRQLTPDDVGDMYNAHYDEIKRYITTNLRSEADAEDILSGIFEGMTRNPPRIRPGNERAYLYAAARNETAGFIRTSRTGGKAVPLEDILFTPTEAVPSVEKLAVQHEFTGELNKMIMNLDPRQREALTLKYIHGFSGAEVAKKLGVTEGVGRQLVNRATIALKKVLLEETGSVSIDAMLQGPVRALQSLAGLPRAALVRLGRNRDFLKSADDALKIIDSEAGHLSMGGEEIARQAEARVLQDIIEGVETSDAALKPIRSSIDNVLNRQTYVDDIPTMRTGESGINVPEHFGDIPPDEVFAGRSYVGLVGERGHEIEMMINHADAGKKLPRHITVDIISKGTEGPSTSSLGDVLKHVYALADTNTDPVIGQIINDKLARVVDRLGFQEVEGTGLGLARYFRLDADTVARVMEERGMGIVKRAETAAKYAAGADPKSYGRVIRTMAQREVGRKIDMADDLVPLARQVDDYVKRTGETLEDLVADFAKTRRVPKDFVPTDPIRTRAARMLDEVKGTLKRFAEGETGGGRLRPLELGDQVRIRSGKYKGQRGDIIRTSPKARRVTVDMDGKVVHLNAKDLDLVPRGREAELTLAAQIEKMTGRAADEVPLPVRTRLEYRAKLMQELSEATPKRARVIEKELRQLDEQEKLIEKFGAAMEEGGDLTTRAKQNEELVNLRNQLDKAKGEGRKAPIRRRIEALEEAMGLSPEGAKLDEAIDTIEQVKEAYVASQSEPINALLRRQREIDFQLAKRKGLMTADEAEDLYLKGKQVAEELGKIRGEADAMTEHLVRAQQQFREGAITPATLTLQEFEKFAFSSMSPVGKIIRFAGKLPLVGRIIRLPTRLTDPSILHSENFVGRAFVAYGRLQEELAASTELTYRTLMAKELPFETLDNGVELISGKPLFDVVEDWDNFKHLYGADQDEFVQLLNQTRLEALRDMRILGADVPDAWFEATHVFRQSLGKEGVNYKNLSRQAGLANVNPLRQRSYEIVARGMQKNVMYNNDIVGVHVAAIHALREHAAETAFLHHIKFEKGVPLKLFIAQEHRLNAVLGARTHTWSKLAKKYVHDSVRGRPPKPGLRASKLYEVEPPTRVVAIVDEIAELNKVKASPARLKRIRELRDEIDAISKKSWQDLQGVKADYARARKGVNLHLQEGTRFGRPGEMLNVSPAPHAKFPKLSGRLYLEEDIDELLKLAGDTKNPFVGLAKGTSRLTGIMKTGQTAFDPGFWFIQGLGPLGMDFANLLTGRPSAIWGKSVWRSMVGFAKGKKAAEFWKNQHAAHPDEFKEFLQHARVLSNHGDYSDEVVAEMIQGGLLDRIEESIPIVNKLHPIKRVGNAFSSFMDAASWETWKSLRPLAKTDQELDELGSFVRNISGRNSARGLGMSYGQEAVERGLMYARSYTRAGAAIMAKATFDPLSFGGRQALKSLAGLGAAATLLLAATSLSNQLISNGFNLDKIDWDDLGNDVKDAWNPTSSKFMSVRVGGDKYFGIGGTIRTNINLVGKLIKLGFNDPKNLSPFDINDKTLINWDNPIIRFVRGKSNPVAGIAWDIASGRDFMGFATDDPKDYWRLPLQAMPFGVQAAMEAHDFGLGERLEVGTAEWFGLRSFPVSSWQLFKEEAERELNDKWENLDGTDFLEQAKNDKDAYPRLYELDQRIQRDNRKRNSEWQKVDDILEENKQEREGKLVPLATEIRWGQPGGGELFSDQNTYYSNQASNDFGVALSALGKNISDVPKEYSNLDEMYEAELGALDPLQFRDMDGNIDWDTYHAERDRILGEMTPRNRAANKEKRFSYADPRLNDALRAKVQASEDLQPYFDAPKYVGLDKEQEVQVDTLIATIDEARALIAIQGGKNVSRGTLLGLMLENNLGDKKIVSTAFVLSKDALAPYVRSTYARDYIFAHPDLAVFYPFVFYDLSDEDQELWIKMYGTRQGPTIGAVPSWQQERGPGQ